MFTTLIVQPILNLTLLVYNTIGAHDLGISIIIMTAAIRLALMPLSLKMARSQRALTRVTPLVDELKEKYKDDSTAQSEAIMRLYKENGISPLAGCLPLLIQLPILIGMYRVFLKIFKPETLSLLYSFVPHPTAINHSFLGLMDMSVPSHLLALIAGAAQFMQAKMMASGQPQSSQAAALNTQMIYLLPAMIVIISWRLPAGLALYWITTSVFSIGEQLRVRRS